jgi:hypothetical protein
MLIGLDFDGVILDYRGVENYWEEDIFEFEPVSDGVIELLETNKIGLILTGRKDLVPVLAWISEYAPSYYGEINSAENFGRSKGLYCVWKGVDIFVDDSDEWCLDLESWGVNFLKFDKDKFKCPKELLEISGYI